MGWISQSAVDPRVLVVSIALAACGSDPDVAADAGLPEDPVVDVVQTWRAYFVPDALEDESNARVGPPYDLPPTDASRWGAVYFEHQRYECTRDGFQSFLLLNPPGVSWATSTDLFVYLHGGGIGAFDSGGTYHPAWLSQRDCLSMVDQEDPQRLLSRWSGDVCSAEWPPTTGLASLIVADADMRVLIASKCDQDVYAGVGLADSRNPWNPDNRIDGLLATVSAVELASQVSTTGSIVLAGASAGGVGVHYVARMLVERGHSVAGLVSDGAVMTDAIDDAFAAAPESCPLREQVADPDDWRPRIGPNAISAHQTHELIAASSTPVFLSWSPADATFCSEAATASIFSAAHDAVLTHDPGRASETRRVCLDGDCNAHALIRWASATAENTERCPSGVCEPILETMHTWIRARRGL